MRTAQNSLIRREASGSAPPGNRRALYRVCNGNNIYERHEASMPDVTRSTTSTFLPSAPGRRAPRGYQYIRGHGDSCSWYSEPERRMHRTEAHTVVSLKASERQPAEHRYLCTSRGYGPLNPRPPPPVMAIGAPRGWIVVQPEHESFDAFRVLYLCLNRLG